MHESTSIPMTSYRPYFFRTILEWINDNDMTPNILVNANADDVDVPLQFVEGGMITLNVAPRAIKNLFIDNEAISFSARFSGVVHNIYVPINAIVAVLVRESRKFIPMPEDDENTIKSEKTASTSTKNDNKPKPVERFSIVENKDNKDDTKDNTVENTNPDNNPDNDPTPTPPTNRPKLRVVK